MRKLTIGFVFAAALVVGGGCKSKPSLVGTWKGSMSISSATVEMEMNFGKDGVLAFTQSAGGQTSIQKGAYKESEKSFTFTPTTMESPTLPKEQLDKINQAMSGKSRTSTFTLEWKDSDTIVISDPSSVINTPFTMKRQS